MTIESPSQERTTPIACASQGVANSALKRAALHFNQEVRQGISTSSTVLSDSDERIGWNIPQWCKASGVSRSFFYALADDLRPAQIKIQRRRIIVEHPAQWLARVGRAA